MARTLLLSSPAYSWREWLKEHRGERDLLCLDPSDPSQAPPGKLTLWRRNKPLAWCFYGSLDSGRAPHVLLAALATLLPMASEDCLVQLFPLRPTPLLRQVAIMCAQMVRPQVILAPGGASLDLEGYPVGPEEIQLEPQFPPLVQSAQRKAAWLKLLENCSEHRVELRRVALHGTRLGSGRSVLPAELERAGLAGAQYGEFGGTTLLVVSDQEPEEAAVSRALDHFHASRIMVVPPSAYDNLLCSFARQEGEDFGMGIIRHVDFASGIAHVSNTAVAPAPVRILRIGGLRVDHQGKELGETKPWSM